MSFSETESTCFRPLRSLPRGLLAVRCSSGRCAVWRVFESVREVDHALARNPSLLPARLRLGLVAAACRDSILSNSRGPRDRRSVACRGHVGTRTDRLALCMAIDRRARRFPMETKLADASHLRCRDRGTSCYGVRSGNDMHVPGLGPLGLVCVFARRRGDLRRAVAPWTRRSRLATLHWQRCGHRICLCCDQRTRGRRRRVRMARLSPGSAGQAPWYHARNSLAWIDLVILALADPCRGL